METMNANTDNPESTDLAALYRRDPRRGFDLLYHSLAGRITTFVKRAFNLNEEEIADVVHDAFLPWVESPGKMAAVGNPRSYLFSTARFLAIRKKRDTTRTTPDDDLDRLPQQGARATATTAAELELDVQAALRGLPTEQREVVTMKIWGDLTFEEIAEIQGVALQTAASRYRYALQKLKENLAWTE
jgi:RNA polymerase sigma-70 factor, ECF subfamily